jgi:CheY-like chemotaxis protein
VASFNQFNLTSSSILVVDDVPENLKLVRILLSKQGFEVHTATTAEDALEMARKIHPRLILADIRLPGMDGLEMTRRLKADPETTDIAIIAITALAMKGDEQKAFDAGCDAYITKPINVKTFPTLIRQHLK